MSEPKPSKTWTFEIGGELAIHRLGFGAMRVTGPGIWGEPADPAEAIRTLKRTRELGIDFIDTADSYGPDVSERLIHEALHPYGDIRIATKAGLARTGQPGLGGDANVAVRVERFVDEALGDVRTVRIGRVDEVDPQLARSFQGADCLRGIGRLAPDPRSGDA